MYRYIVHLFIILIYISGRSLLAQTVAISDPEFELKNGFLQISYDILNSERTDNYLIELEISDSLGQKIDASAFAGDIGHNVSGGRKKRITWNLVADNIYMDADIFITINAKKIAIGRVAEAPVTSRNKSNTRSNIMLRSFLVPGLGLSKLSGKPHWIKGAVGYSCIISSFIFYDRSLTSYESYKNQTDISRAQDYFNTSKREDFISEALAIASIGIWLSDLVWTFIKTSNPSFATIMGSMNLSLFAMVDTQIYAPMAGIKMSF